MLGRIVGILGTCLFATGILIFSIFHSTAVHYTFGQSPSPSPSASEKKVEIDYVLPYPGRVLPDNLFWSFKVMRDKVWLLVTTNPLKKAEISLLLADKRLASAQTLFEEDKIELAVSTLTKAEKYLEKAFIYEQKARAEGVQTGDFLTKLATASLKHQETMREIASLAPGDVEAVINRTAVYAERVYRDTKNLLGSMGRDCPENPFN